MSGLTSDLAQELRRFLPPPAMTRQERVLAPSIIIAAGAEAVFHRARNQSIPMKSIREFLSGFMLTGLSGWPWKADPRR